VFCTQDICSLLIADNFGEQKYGSFSPGYFSEDAWTCRNVAMWKCENVRMVHFCTYRLLPLVTGARDKTLKQKMMITRTLRRAVNGEKYVIVGWTKTRYFAQEASGNTQEASGNIIRTNRLPKFSILQ
jgi:hypothetical protein